MKYCVMLILMICSSISWAGRYIVVLHEDSKSRSFNAESYKKLEELYQKLNVRRVQALSGAMSGFQIVDFDASEFAVRKTLAQNESVKWVAKDREVIGFGAEPVLNPRPKLPINPLPDPKMTDRQAYGVKNVRAVQAWGYTWGSENVIIANIDSGIDYNHPDLAYNLWRNPKPGPMNDIVGYDFVNEDGVPWDDCGHGTQTAGIMAATGFNGLGLTGVSPRVSVMSLKFLDENNRGLTSNAIRAMSYAVEHGARIISASWGSYGWDEDAPVLEEAIRRLEDANVLYVAPAGNKAIDNDTSSDRVIPSTLENPNIVAVTSTDINDEKPMYAAWGLKSIDLGAPGGDVLTTLVGGKYRDSSGTSLAVPFVSAAAALLLSLNPDLTWKDLKELILSTTDRVPYLDKRTVTGGRLNIESAILKMKAEGYL